MKASLTYFIDSSIQRNELNYVFDFIFKTIGIRAKEVIAHEQADLYYGNGNSNAPIVIRHNPAEVITDLKKMLITSRAGMIEIDTDIVNSSCFFLLDKGNQGLPQTAYDKHDRLLFQESYQYKHGIHTRPLVNELVNTLETFIKGVFPDIEIIPRWPDNKKAVIVLSHDVDNPQKYAALKNLHKSENSSGFIKLLKYVNGYRKYFVDSHRNEYWLFNEVLQEEAKYNFKSTFFFASRSKYDKGSSPNDVDYCIEDKEFANIFKAIAEQGCETGLHAGYLAFEGVNNFVWEKERLERASKMEVIGLRHHYWHLGKDATRTLGMHKEAGFKYDSSLSFNYNIGFRYNTALPFYPYNTAKGQMINCMQLPPFCMDMGLFNRDDMTVEAGLTTLKQYINIIKDTGGLGAVNWHDYTSYPTRKYEKVGSAYVQLLNMLASDYKDIWVTSCKEAYSWIKQKENMINN